MLRPGPHDGRAWWRPARQSRWISRSARSAIRAALWPRPASRDRHRPASWPQDEPDVNLALLPTFANLYTQTMARLGASDFYFFDEDDFRRLACALPGMIHLLVTSIDGEVASAGLFFEYGGVVEWHLVGLERRVPQPFADRRFSSMTRSLGPGVEEIGFSTWAEGMADAMTLSCGSRAASHPGGTHSIRDDGSSSPHCTSDWSMPGGPRSRVPAHWTRSSFHAIGPPSRGFLDLIPEVGRRLRTEPSRSLLANWPPSQDPRLATLRRSGAAGLRVGDSMLATDRLVSARPSLEARRETRSRRNPGSPVRWTARSTWRTVIARILTSSDRLQLSTYQTSSSSRSSNRSACRPFTAAQPVIPGRISCRRRSRERVMREVLR